MNQEELKALAAQLRNPEGDFGQIVGGKMNEGNSLINLQTISRLNIQPYDEILEIGMGNGFFVKNILSAHDTTCYSGCDISSTMVEEAKKHNRHFIENGQAEFILTDGISFPFENETFSKVFTIDSIYFWDTPGPVFSEIKRVLKPGGQLFIAIRPKSIMKAFPMSKYGFNMFTKEELIDIVVKNGFTMINSSYQEEPDQELENLKLKVASLILCAEK